MIRSMTVLAAVLALVVPAVASAAPDVSSSLSQERYYGSYGDAQQPNISAATAQERYYSSYGAPAPSASPVPAAPGDDDAPWKALAIVSGALVLALLAAEVVTLTRLRRAT